MLRVTGAGSRKLVPTLLKNSSTVRSRYYATVTQSPPSRDGLSLPDTPSQSARRLPKKEGTIADVFSFMSSEPPPLPQRFADLKKQIYNEAIVQSWREVLEELTTVTEEIVTLGGKVPGPS